MPTASKEYKAIINCAKILTEHVKLICRSTAQTVFTTFLKKMEGDTKIITNGRITEGRITEGRITEDQKFETNY